MTRLPPPTPWLIAGIVAGAFASAAVLAVVADNEWQRLIGIAAFVICAVFVMPVVFLPIWFATNAIRAGYLGAMICGGVAYFVALTVLGFVTGRDWTASDLADSLWFAGAGSIAGLVFWVVAFGRRAGDQA